MKMLLVLCLVYGYFIQSATCATDSNTTVVEGTFVNGGTLIKMGRRNSQPMLTLIGMAIQNLQDCEWTHWSACTAVRLGYFGTRSRTRTCSREHDEGNRTVDTEEDIRVCEGNCPVGYNQTDDGYCLKLYTTRANWTAAEEMCQNDGGHLVYIGTLSKFTDVKNMLKGFRANVWIDARRNSVNSPWKNVNNDTLTTFFWLSGQPNNYSYELCIVLYHLDSREWIDNSCSSLYSPLCEILV